MCSAFVAIADRSTTQFVARGVVEFLVFGGLLFTDGVAMYYFDVDGVARTL